MVCTWTIITLRMKRERKHRTWIKIEIDKQHKSRKLNYAIKSRDDTPHNKNENQILPSIWTSQITGFVLKTKRIMGILLGFPTSVNYYYDFFTLINCDFIALLNNIKETRHSYLLSLCIQKGNLQVKHNQPRFEVRDNKIWSNEVHRAAYRVME